MESTPWRLACINLCAACNTCKALEVKAQTQPKIIAFVTPTNIRMPKAKSPAVSEISTPPASYELAVAELEQLAVAMESGQLPLGDMMNGYRRASFLLEFCRQQLDSVEAQIRALDEGQAKPWSPN